VTIARLLIVVNTRCVYYRIKDLTADHGDNMTLAPLIDMINHSSDENVTIDRVEDALEIRATREIQVGEELNFSYHSRPSRFWLVEYGFIPDDNVYDDLDISPEIEEIALDRKEWLTNEDYWGFHHFLLIGIDDREYTITSDGFPSFRTEVAIMSTLIFDEGELRKFLEGNYHYEGSKAVEEMQDILRKILNAKVEECRRFLSEPIRRLVIESHPHVMLATKLWTGELDIATAALINLGPPRDEHHTENTSR